jgi:hypothetical protein
MSLQTFQRPVLPPSSRHYTHRPDDGGSTDLWNVGKLIPVYTALQPWRQPSPRKMAFPRVASLPTGAEMKSSVTNDRLSNLQLTRQTLRCNVQQPPSHVGSLEFDCQFQCAHATQNYSWFSSAGGGTLWGSTLEYITVASFQILAPHVYI